MSSSGFQRVNGLRLWVHRFREAAVPPSGLTIVLVHGFPNSSEVWEPVARHLAQRFHVVAYAVRGASKRRLHAALTAIDALDQHLPRRRGIESRDALNGRRLAGPVWSQQSEAFAGTDVERDSAYGLKRAARAQSIGLL